MGRRLVSDKVVSDDIVGTNGYHAPEVLFDDSYDIRADIFMLGITFCVMVGDIAGLFFHSPFDDFPQQRVRAAKHVRLFLSSSL